MVGEVGGVVVVGVICVVGLVGVARGGPSLVGVVNVFFWFKNA